MLGEGDRPKSGIWEMPAALLPAETTAEEPPLAHLLEAEPVDESESDRRFMLGDSKDM